MEDQEQYGGQADRGEQMVGDLVTALKEQTKAITSLVESNQRLMMILVESACDEDEASASVTYLDGSLK